MFFRSLVTLSSHFPCLRPSLKRPYLFNSFAVFRETAFLIYTLDLYTVDYIKKNQQNNGYLAQMSGNNNAVPADGAEKEQMPRILPCERRRRGTIRECLRQKHRIKNRQTAPIPRRHRHIPTNILTSDKGNEKLNGRWAVGRF